MNNATEKALMIISAVEEELLLGTEHYNRAGKLLQTPLEIVQTMRDEGGVTVKPHLLRATLLYNDLGRKDED